MTPHPVLIDWAGSAELAQEYQAQLVKSARDLADTANRCHLPFAVVEEALRQSAQRSTKQVIKLGLNCDLSEATIGDELERAALEVGVAAARERWQELGAWS